MSPSHESARPQSAGEEIANSLSHAAGLLAALIATPLLITAAIRRDNVWAVVGASVFAVTAGVLYLSSTLYHAAASPRTKRMLQVLDHAAIFLLIAGTYTPFTLGVLRGPWGWSLLGVVWSVALAGIVLKARGRLRHDGLSTGLYLGLGWLVLVAAWPLWQRLPPAGLVWLLAGGLAYTAGVAFYAAGHLRYRHFVWHLFVLAGSACHYCAVLWYAA